MKIYFVDSFTTEKFKGNPAAVCLLENPVTEGFMKQVAREIGFSETAFIQSKDENEHSIRFFSPQKEIPLCGHATLASAKILFDKFHYESITFVNVEGIRLRVGKFHNKIAMQFPLYETKPATVPDKMLEALGIESIIQCRYSEQNKIIMLEIAEASQLQALTPDFKALVNSYSNINGVLVTAGSPNKEYDFYYRYFWPWAGTNEDPVSGGVQTFLTKYWFLKLGKTKLNAFQSSARTGTMTTELLDDCVMIYGDAVLVLEGDLKI